MIHKQISAMAIALTFLLIVYSIATATNWQDPIQPLISDSTNLNSESSDTVDSISLTGPFAGHVTPMIAGNTGTESVQKSTQMGLAKVNDEVQAVPLEQTLNPTWLLGWMVQGIAILAFLTGAISGLFWLLQRSPKA